MVDIRSFIKNLGDDAPAYFGVKPETVKRWIKTGNVPIAKAQQIFAAMSAVERSTPPPQTSPEAPQVAQDPDTDPFTHLPKNMEKRLPQISGKPPDWIEADPTEQSFGNNMTRPGRVEVRPLPPMKLREEGGQMVAYVDNTPKTPVVLPPTISNEGWANQGQPLPAPIKKPNPNDPRPAQRTAENIP